MLVHWFTKINIRFQLIIMAVLVGVFGGVAAVLLNLAIHHTSVFVLPYRTRWYAIVLPALGIFLAVYVLRVVFRDQGEHGVPEVIYAISKRGGLLRIRTSISRLLSCFLTLVSGGSVGPEAPVVISGASIGSGIANRFRLKDKQRSIIVGCGASAAISAIFNAPTTGIIFTMEAVIGEWTKLNLIPVAIASVVGTSVSRLLRGDKISFEYRLVDVIGYRDLIACVVLALLTAVVSVLFVRVLRFVSHQMEFRLKSIWLRAATGGIVVGIIGIYFPEVLGEGYRGIREIINNNFDARFFVVAAMILAKIVATSVTSGAGGVGGVFAPCLVLGAFTGLFFRDAILAMLPGTAVAEQGYYALLGMSGVVSSVLQAPLTGIFLVVEITGGYDVLLSVVLVSMLSATLSGFFEPHSLYHRELLRRGTLLRNRTDARILSDIRIPELLETDCQSVAANLRLGELVGYVEKSNRNYFPVVDPSTTDYLGLINLADIKSYLFEPGLYSSVLAEELMDADVPTAHPEDELSTVMNLMEESNSFSLPVVENNKFLGLISKATILDSYRKEMIAQEDR